MRLAARLVSLLWCTVAVAAPDIRSVPADLVLPELVDGPAAPGRRVKVGGGEKYHVLYLPTDWRGGESGERHPVMVEFPGNGGYRNRFGDECGGRPEDCRLGFGFSGGTNWIWVALPFLNDAGDALATTWWGDPPGYRPDATVAYCREVVDAVCRDHGGDSNRVVLTGFSRGAIACNAVGLREPLADLWAGFLPYSHYEGVRSWPYSATDGEPPEARRARLRGRPLFVVHESGGGITGARRLLAGERARFVETGFRNHNDAWTLRPSPARAEIREWLAQWEVEPLERIVAASNRFVGAASGEPFRVWGVNYDHDADGALLEDYWTSDWARVVEDFGEIRELGANLVRVHLQLGRFMRDAGTADPKALARLDRLVDLAAANRLHLDVTGLGCYHKADVPAWYDALPEAERWRTQAAFWTAVARVCRGRPAVFCYDLMNEPILPGKTVGTEWLAGELGGKHFVQRLALDARGRSREEIAKAWIDLLVGAIREEDPDTMVTVGAIPWNMTWPGAKPLFHGPEVGARLDFAAIHVYPRREAEGGTVEAALQAMAAYELGKPVLVEETFPLHCGQDALLETMERSRGTVDGWVSFYWGRTAEEYDGNKELAAAIIAKWLRAFRDHAPQPAAPPNQSRAPRSSAEPRASSTDSAREAARPPADTTERNP